MSSSQYLFQPNLSKWSDWEAISTNSGVFSSLIQEILYREKLFLYKEEKVENLPKGTNAVFRVSDIVVKIYPPDEITSGFSISDFNSEIFGMKFSEKCSVTAAKLITSGTIEDKYIFHYLIIGYVNGRNLADYLSTLAPKEQYKTGKKLRAITNKLNIRTKKFNEIDIFNDKNRNFRWEGYSDAFKNGRLLHIKTRKHY